MAACHEANSKLVMYFTVKIAFVNYLDQFTNLTESLKFLIFDLNKRHDTTDLTPNKISFLTVI